MLTKEKAFVKIKQFCAYQERCHSEVTEKLHDFNLESRAVEKLVDLLVKENYLNEERFALQFAGGKFRMKQWGKIKIKYALRQRQVNAALIKKAIDQINDDDYMSTLDALASRKILSLRSERNVFKLRKKMSDYLMQKGYEPEIIFEWLERSMGSVHDPRSTDHRLISPR